MNTESNTFLKVKIKPEEVERLIRILPYRSLRTLAANIGVSKQVVNNRLKRISIKNIQPDGTVLIDKETVEEAIKILKESGNSSFDYLLNSN